MRMKIKSSSIQTTDLIKEVKCRPGIFDKDKLKHPKKVHKQQLWLEIAEIFSGSQWTEYTEAEKEVKCDEIQMKWKYLRGHYLEAVKKYESGITTKKYIYYDEMDFIRPFVGLKIMPVNKSLINNSLNKCQAEKSESISEQNQTNVSSNEDFEDADDEDYEPKEKQTKKIIKHSNKQNKLNFSSIRKSNSQSNSSFQLRDGDISFCLSLVPTLRRMKDSQKMRAKIDLLKVLHRYIEHDERQLDQQLKKKRAAEQEDQADDTMHSESSTFEDKTNSINIKCEKNDSGNDKEWWT